MHKQVITLSPSSAHFEKSVQRFLWGASVAACAGVMVRKGFLCFFHQQCANFFFASTVCRRLVRQKPAEEPHTRGGSRS